LSSGTGIGAPPTPPDHQPAEVGGRERRVLRHELVDRGHAEKLVDALRGIADQLQRRARIERAHDQDGAAGMQHRIGVAIQPAGVEQRQQGQQHRRRRDVSGSAEIDAIPERHAMGDDRALGLARGARGVHDGRDVIERDGLSPIERLCRCDRGFVGTAGPEQQRRCNVAELCDRERDLGEVAVMDHHLWRRIADDELQLGHGEAGVQRQKHRADPAAGELHFQRIGRVQRQHRDAVAAHDFQCVAQMGGKARNPRIELRVSETPLAREIDGRDLVRRPAAEMGDPVVVANRQILLRRFLRSGAADPSFILCHIRMERPYWDTVLR
jgi:hypothetical protein